MASRTASTWSGFGVMVATTTTDNGAPRGRGIGETRELVWCPRPGRVRMPVVSADGSATPPSADRPLRVAVVGAGPAGIYAADALTRQDDVPVAVDLIDRLPTPFGLVRHGIAPDHPKMRAIRDTLHRTLDHPRVRFVGNVEIGQDISLAELRTHVDAVIYT